MDKNPLAVDLCKVALWIEGHAAGLPLGFLDHHIKCGDSLVGVSDLSVLTNGIPDDAYKTVTGDDKEAAKLYRQRNKQERTGQRSMVLETPQAISVSPRARSLVCGIDVAEKIRLCGKVRKSPNSGMARTGGACSLGRQQRPPVTCSKPGRIPMQLAALWQCDRVLHAND